MRRSHHVDYRGNTHNRRRRREWILNNPAFGGTGKSVFCYHCHRRVRRFDVDRYPRCGHMGGRYWRSNIVPACARCNRGVIRNGRCMRNHGAQT